MPSGSHTLLWYPRKQQIERASPGRPLSDPDSFALHRTFGGSLELGAAHVELGAELLPEGERPAYGASIKLLWADSPH